MKNRHYLRAAFAVCLAVAFSSAEDAQALQKMARALRDSLYAETLQRATGIRENGFGLDVRFLQPNDSAGTPGLGVRFNFDRELKHQALTPSDWAPVLSMRVSGYGNVAMHQADNPENLLVGEVSLGLRQSIISKRPGDALASLDEDYKQKVALKKAQLDKAELAAYERSAEAEAYMNYARVVQESLHSFIWEGYVDGATEATQDFSSRQFAFGGRLSATASLGETKRFLNIFDYPMALVRWVLDPNEKLGPDGHAFPSLTLRLDWVEPVQNTVRRDFDASLYGFPRFGLEAAYKSKVLTNANGPVVFSTGFRYYQEINSPAAIERNGLDSYEFLTFRLGFPGGIGISYSKGKLPLDASDKDAFALGWDYWF